jgi:hypothetical protein
MYLRAFLHGKKAIWRGELRRVNCSTNEITFRVRSQIRSHPSTIVPHRSRLSADLHFDAAAGRGPEQVSEEASDLLYRR